MKRLMLVLLVLLLVHTTAGAVQPWSKARTQREARKACVDLKIRTAEIPWFLDAVDDIIYTGHHPHIFDRDEKRESSGRFWATNGPCWGLAQFDNGWHQLPREKQEHKSHIYKVRDWRLCPDCSIRRMARVYRDGGRPKMKQHWNATLGR